MSSRGVKAQTGYRNGDLRQYDRQRLVIERATSTGSARAVLLVLVEHANQRKGMTAYPGVDRIAKLAGISRRTVFEALKRLEDLGEISKARRGGGKGRTTTWQIDILLDGWRAEQSNNANPAPFGSGPNDAEPDTNHADCAPNAAAFAPKLSEQSESAAKVNSQDCAKAWDSAVRRLSQWLLPYQLNQIGRLQVCRIESGVLYLDAPNKFVRAECDKIRSTIEDAIVSHSKIIQHVRIL